MTNGDGTGDSPLDDTGVADPPPPPDLDYAKKATDMVLDYLDENRDQIDNDLLEELNWSAEDLERFRKRWENVRDIDQPATDPNQSEQLKDALKSLGLRPSQSTNGTAARKSDGLRSINDSGNRRRVPASLREAFEAFQKR
ncbi:hypothetical protein C2E31_03580 [Rhodopirellula baltica]|nr:hypothetical protein C2E31_03580 [Rhodopirellula baltica]